MPHDKLNETWVNLYRTFRNVAIDRMLELTSVAVEALSCLAASPQVESRSGRDSHTTHRKKVFPHALDRFAAKALWLVREHLAGLVQPAIPFSY